jgi:hypothetical protein
MTIGWQIIVANVKSTPPGGATRNHYSPVMKIALLVLIGLFLARSAAPRALRRLTARSDIDRNSCNKKALAFCIHSII